MRTHFNHLTAAMITIRRLLHCLPRLAAAICLLAFAGSRVRAEFQTGQYADRALGDNSHMPESSALRPISIATDPVTHKVFVVERDRCRVLRFASLESGAEPEAVLGQPDMELRQNPAGQGTTGMTNPVAAAMDAFGHLWVADKDNNRVLRFDNAATLPSGSPASGVLGQADLNSDAGAAGAAGMNHPFGLSVTPDGTLWVADAVNRRVLRFDNAATKPNGAAANAVLGQPNFTADDGPLSPSSTNFGFPLAVCAEAVGGITQRLWVADYGYKRVLRYDLPKSKSNGTAADGVLGQPNFTADSPDTTQTGMALPRAVAAVNNQLWVADEANNRVLSFDNASTKANGGAADGVLGQSTFLTSASGDSATNLHGPSGLALDGTRLWVAEFFGHRVVRHENAAQKANGAAADGVLGQLCMDGISCVSSRAMGSGIRGMAIDPESGKLFVCDRQNNRVLRFASAASLSTNEAAEAVFGQPDFTSNAAGAAANQMERPAGAAVDHFGHLWVADYENNRVLRFDNASTAASGASASRVLGQSGFNQTTAGLSAGRMAGPTALAVESTYSGGAWQTVRLWVADTSNSRVLAFNSPVSVVNGGGATKVLGQVNFVQNQSGTGAAGLGTPTGLCVDTSGRLWVSDENANRVLRYDNAGAKANGAAANGVLLQPDFASWNDDVTRSGGSHPSGLCVSPAGRLFVCDFFNRRVLWFNNAAALPNGAPADGVLGLPDFTTSGAATTDWNSMGWTAACVLDLQGHLWVGDDNAKRMLRFSPEPDTVADFYAKYFGTPFGNPNGDPDGDGVVNLMEYAQGTDPQNAASVSRIQILQDASGRPRINCQLTYPAKADLRVTFQYSINMQPGWWFTLGQRSGTGAWTGAWLPTAATFPSDNKMSWSVLHTDATPDKAVFYRVKVEVLP